MHELERESELVSDVGHQLTASVRCDAMDLFGRRFFLLQLRDITEQRQLLIASELRFAQLAASLPDAAIFMFDHDLRLLLVLGEAMRANGYDPDAHLGALHTQRHPSTRCSTCTADEACVEPGTPDAHLGALHTQHHPSTRCSTCTADRSVRRARNPRRPPRRSTHPTSPVHPLQHLHRRQSVRRARNPRRPPRRSTHPTSPVHPLQHLHRRQSMRRARNPRRPPRRSTHPTSPVHPLQHLHRRRSVRRATGNGKLVTHYCS